MSEKDASLLSDDELAAIEDMVASGRLDSDIFNANVDAEASGYTPLHNAAYRGSLEITKLLIVKGANINASDINGDTPLDWTSGETAKLLRKHGGKAGKELKAEGK